MQTESESTSRAKLGIAPNPAYADEEVTIRGSGFSPKARITLRARVSGEDGRAWTSWGIFQADSEGRIDPSLQDSLGGTYRGHDAMGLFWSMQLESRPGSRRTIFRKSSAVADCVNISAEVQGRLLASAELQRRWLAPRTEVREARDEGLVAQLFLPPGRGPHRAIIVLGGSGGGHDLDKAALLARHGFATLALAYFGVAPLPQWLHRVPLEYFEHALAWLARQPEIDSHGVGVLGVSRGAELALLLASAYPQIRAVAAYAPSAIAWGSGGRDKATGEIIPCWTLHGRPVPFAPLPLRNFMMRSAIPVSVLRRPVKFRSLFRSALRDREAAALAKIPVERIRGPILLVSGGDDHVWPSSAMANAIVERLRSRGFTHHVEHLNYPHAGHALRYPFLPTTSRIAHSGGLKYPISFGGDALADSAAQTAAWRRTILFFGENL